MRILHPELVLLGLLVIPAILLWLRGYRRRRSFLKLFSVEQRRNLLKGGDGGRRFYPLIYLFSIPLFALILARFQYGLQSEIQKFSGRDIVFVVDLSRSMNTKDVTPSRLGLVKLELQVLLDMLKGDRVGLVVFAGSAAVELPLTTDYDLAREFIRQLNTSLMRYQGTNIADALRKAEELLDADKNAKDRSKVIILFSDGEDTTGGDPVKVARELASKGITLITVGVGTPTGEPVPIFDERGNLVGYKKDENGKLIVSKMNMQLLSKLAEITGGVFLQLQSGGVAGKIMSEIKKIEKSTVEKRVFSHYEDRYYWFAAPLFILLLIEALLRVKKNEA